MENKTNSPSIGFLALIVYLVLLGAVCLNFVTSDPWGFMGISAAILVGGIGLAISPLILVIGLCFDRKPLKDTEE